MRARHLKARKLRYSFAVTVLLVLGLILLGHKTIQRFERGMSVVLGILFVIILKGEEIS